MFAALLLSLVDFKTVKAPTSAEPSQGDWFMAALGDWLGSDSFAGLAFVAGLGALLWVLLARQRRQPVKMAKQWRPDGDWILVDGSNVMHWQDKLPQIDPLRRVVEDLKRLGYAPGVVFDANAGWKLFGRYVNESEMAFLLDLPREQVLVAPKGTPADPYLLMTALEFKARIVTNDRYRDWAGEYPEVQDKGFLIPGGLRDGRVWLKGLGPAASEKA